MCSECYATPCHPQCPNAPEPKEVYHCELCDEGIYSGEDMVEINEKCYHTDCLDVEELLKIFGVEQYVCLGDGWL